MKKLSIQIITICFLLFLAAGLYSCSGERPTDIGVTNGQLKACPDKPNCINTFASEDQHAMAGLAFKGNAASSMAAIKTVVESMPRTTLVSETANYLHYEFMTPTMKYVDDVEFYFDAASQKVQFRSASRLGHSDLGLNRKRMESITAAYVK